ncbi:MAG: hypothetical protein RL150_670 [Candidatus Parcubacteria bacterium]|jgi:hypothetical protein
MQPVVARGADIVIPLPITAGVLWGVFVLALLVVGAISWMFVHHWGYYGVEGNNRVFVKGLYFTACIGLFVLSALLISAYALTS